MDFDNRTISVNHSLVYYPANGSNKCVLRVSLPKTDAGIRSIPMRDIVKDAFEMLYEEQKEYGFNETEIDGMTGFIFCNRFGSVPNPQTVNRTIAETKVQEVSTEIYGDRRWDENRRMLRMCQEDVYITLDNQGRKELGQDLIDLASQY